MTGLLALQLVPADLPLWAQWVFGVSIVVIAIALVLGAVLFVAAGWAALRLVRALGAVVGRLQEQATPVIDQARAVAEDAREISSVVRDEVRQIRGAVDGSLGRLEGATRAAETRVRELGALLSVVQEEAERLFLDTASTLRGLRAGAEALRSGDLRGPPAAEDEEVQGAARELRVHRSE